MSDDEADPELLELLRQSLGLTNRPKDEISSDTGVLKDAEYIYDNAIDVSIDMYGTKAAAAIIYASMKERGYSTQAWSQQDLHPTRGQGFSDVDMVNFIFTMDLLNFSFWSELPQSERFQVEYRGKRWTGYSSLLACLRRALDEDIQITTPRYWNDPTCTDDVLKHIFRSATKEDMPLLSQRIAILREAGQVMGESFGDPEVNMEEPAMPSTVGEVEIDPAAGAEGGSGTQELVSTSDECRDVDSRAPQAAATETLSSQNIATNEAPDVKIGELEPQPLGSNSQTEAEPISEQETNAMPPLSNKTYSTPDLSVVRLIEKADHSAGKLVNLLVKFVPSFRDETRFNGRKVRFFKRAQIFVADLWAAFNGIGSGKFDDIGHLTMFADYRVPQMLNSIGVLVYSPPLDYAVRDRRKLKSGDRWEVQLRGCSIWAVELIRREILKVNPEALNINAVLIDFFLYDLAKERESSGAHPHHHTRSIFY